MSGTDLIKRFCDVVNDGLSRGEDQTSQALKDLQQQVQTQDELVLLENIYQNFCAAINPTNFFNAAVRVLDERFEQCYELLRITFEEDERDSRKRLIGMLEMAQVESTPAPLVLMGRFWRVSGSHIYDQSGQLRRFYYDPLAVSENIVGAISGNYMPIQSLHTEKTGTSIGAIGNMATRVYFRGKQGHGTNLAQAFEKQIETMASSRGDKLQLMALEAQKDSVGFWLKNGYRWAEGTRYAQPPLDFDPVTGERNFDEVPEFLMVKLIDNPGASYVDAQLLADSVYTMYQNWCLAKTVNYPPVARKRAVDYVIGKVFSEFLQSLPKEGGMVRLTETVG
jgi:hypothetical protein